MRAPVASSFTALDAGSAPALSDPLHAGSAILSSASVSETAEQKKARVVIGMSGGVDSTTAAKLLLDQGYDVVGITLKTWPQDCISRAEDKCCGPQAVSDARNVCHNLGIPYYLIDESEAFQKQVVDYFAAEYRAGRTPNPCVMCNEKVKFGTLISRARQLGGEKIATGHYARLRRDETTGRTLLLRGRDERKDQSYFLFSLRQDQLERSLFPLGEMSKSDTRDVAREASLKTADKEESMEICFVPDDDYRGFLQKADLAQKHKGEIVDSRGKVLGHHDGIEFYTIGQRRGLGISSPTPLYVIELDAANHRVVVGSPAMPERMELQVSNCNWIPFENLTEPIEVTARIRYNHSGTPATVEPGEGWSATVKLHESQRAITPGQACVFYQDDLVVGGGWIAA